MREGVIPDVYVQSEKYWKEYEKEIKQLYGHDIGKTNKVALHIRRGDYLKAYEFHVNLWETEYYKKAIEYFPNEKFLVFCKDNQNELQDAADRRWCEENLPALLGERFEMAPSFTTETEDMNLMASCKSVIMANSTFSWWAAYLGEHEKVICPAQWFTDGIQRCELLDEWIKI